MEDHNRLCAEETKKCMSCDDYRRLLYRCVEIDIGIEGKLFRAPRDGKIWRAINAYVLSK